MHSGAIQGHTDSNNEQINRFTAAAATTTTTSRDFSHKLAHSTYAYTKHTDT